MSAHGSQFDDHLLREARDAACGLPPGGHTTKVRSGRVGDHSRDVPVSVLAELDAIWAREVEPELGLASYDALRAALAAD